MTRKDKQVAALIARELVHAGRKRGDMMVMKDDNGKRVVLSFSKWVEAIFERYGLTSAVRKVK